MCTIRSEQAKRYSATKSRSATDCSEVSRASAVRKRCQLPLDSAGGERRTRLHRVAADRVKPEFGTEQLAVDAEGVAGEGARAEREDRDTPRDKGENEEKM
jgi:hypothetical protein